MNGSSGDVAWSELLERNLARRVVWSRTGGALPWALFRAGPVVLAYPRFPLGLGDNDAWVLDSLPAVQSELAANNVDLLRMSAPMGLLAALPRIRIESSAPETVVERLGDWRAQDLAPTVRRKFRQAEKAGLVVRPAEAADGAACHSLYVRSVSRHRGALRYSKLYFDDLCATSASAGPVVVTKALTADGRIAGFLATLRQSDSVYYLHGGYRDDCAAMRPGYFLMRWSLEAAREAGQRRFNFLTSPLGQPALLAYKESFGGRSSQRSYWQQPLTAMGSMTAWSLRLLASVRTRRVAAQALDSNSMSA